MTIIVTHKGMIMTHVKAESLMSNSTGQRPVWLMMVLSLRPERAIAIKNRLTPFQGYGWTRTFHHRALPLCYCSQGFQPYVVKFDKKMQIINR
jgi:hypothetical protein